MAFYIPSKDFVFIHIPKTGGTSILEWIKNNFEYEKKCTKHCGIKKWRSRYPNQGQFYFTVVRNPYTRILSWFHYQGKMAYKRLEKNKSRQNDEKIINIYEKGFKKWLSNNNDNLIFNKTIRHQQTDYFDSSCNYILHTENLNNEFYQVQKYLGNYNNLIKINISYNSKIDYKSVYDNHTKKIVESLYEKDFELLKYTF